MATDTKLIIGGVAIAAIGLYLVRDKIKGLFAGPQEVSETIGDVTSNAGDALNSWIDILNLKKDAAALSNLAGYFQSKESGYQQQLADLTAKNQQLANEKANILAQTPTYITPKSVSSGSGNRGYTLTETGRVKPANVSTDKVIGITGGLVSESSPFAFVPNMSSVSNLPTMAVGTGKDTHIFSLTG